MPRVNNTARTLPATIKVAKKYASQRNPALIKLAPGAYFTGDFKLYSGPHLLGADAAITEIIGRALSKLKAEETASLSNLTLTAWNSPVLVPYLGTRHHDLHPPCIICRGVTFNKTNLNSI